jgi:hypothetical protein
MLDRIRMGKDALSIDKVRMKFGRNVLAPNWAPVNISGENVESPELLSLDSDRRRSRQPRRFDVRSTPGRFGRHVSQRSQVV